MAIRQKIVKMYPVGADGSAAATAQLNFGRPGIVRGLSVAVGGQPTTVDVTVKADTSTGATLCTMTNISADQPAGPVSSDGYTDDLATAADMANGGFFFSKGLYLSLAQGDAYVSSTEDDGLTVTFWIEF